MIFAARYLKAYLVLKYASLVSMWMKILQSTIIIVTSFMPVIGWANVAEENTSNPFDMFYSILNRND
jgi:hypothetical protein